MQNAFTLVPAQIDTALVIDSPHSWRDWPADGVPTVAPETARLTSWDAWIDELWIEAAQGSASVLSANFHRAWLDANRARDDLDVEMLDQPWPGPVQPSATTQRGMGLVRRYALPGVPMYDQPLSAAEVRSRIERCYDPYHAELQRLLDAAHRHFGHVVHLDCHSMKSTGNAMNTDAGRARPDMVVSDRNGTTAASQVVRAVVRGLEQVGYQVAINDPYQGGEIIRKFGDPDAGRHSVQIEINRALYMDEQRFEKTAGYSMLAANLRTFVAGLQRELRDRLCEPTPQGAAR